MRRLDFFELIAQQPQRFFLLPIDPLLGGANIFARFANSGRIFSGIYPRHGEGQPRIEFTHRLGRVVVALAFHAHGRIGNPGTARELELRLLHVDLCARHLDFGPLSERDVTQLRDREMRLVDCRCYRRAKRRERVAIHQRVELRLRVR